MVRKALPALSHWYHLTPPDLDVMTYGEIETYLATLKDLPPIGGIVQVQPRR